MLSFHSLHYSPMFGGRAALVDVLDAAAAAGFTSMGVDLASVAAAGRDARLGELGSAFRDRGLRCSDVAVIVVAADATATLQSARACVEVAEQLSAPTCVLAVRDVIDWSSLLATSRECASMVEAAGARLAVEFLTYSPIATLEQAMQLCEGIGWARAGLLLDSLHVSRTGTDLASIRALKGGQIQLVQLSDAPSARPADLVDESRNRRLLPGQGGLDLGAFVEAVKSTGYDRDVGAEVLSSVLRAEDPVTVAVAMKAALQRTWSPSPSS
jgi:sugar phosphate isomerase/epimerase